MNAEGEIFKLIPKIMKAVGAVTKDRRNEQQKYAFRGIEDFYAAAQPAMIEFGVFCVPRVMEREVYRFEKTNEQGRVTTWCHVALKVDHYFYAGDGSRLPEPVTTWGEGLDNSDKATNKAMSAAMKYAYIELLCVPTKDVEDADRTSPETGKARVQVGEKPVMATAPTLPKANGAKSAKVAPGQITNFEKTFTDALRKELKKDAENIYGSYLVLNKINFDTMTTDDFWAARDEAERYARNL